MEITLARKDLMDLIKKTVYAVSDENEKYPSIMGLLLHNEDDILKAVGTDSFRIAIAKTQNIQLYNDLKVIIPKRKAKELIKILTEVKDKDINIAQKDNAVMFSSNSFEFISETIDARYPEYQKVIPEFRETITISKEDLVDTIKELSLKPYKKDTILLHIEKGMVQLEGVSTMKTKDLPLEYEGEPFSVAFNPEYILNAIRPIKETVIMRVPNNRFLAYIFEGLDDNSYIAIVMPKELKPSWVKQK